MKTDNIPMISYLFIGVTSLVLTYATIDDTRNEFILTPPSEEQSSIASTSISMPEINVPSLTETVDKLKSLNPFSTQPNVFPAPESTSVQVDIPVAVAVPVDQSSVYQSQLTKPQTSGGNKSKKNQKHKPKKTRRTRN